MSERQSLGVIDDFEQALDALTATTDIIVAHHANLSTIAAARVARRRNIPYVVFIHGTGIEPRSHGGYADSIWNQIVQAVVGASGIVVTTAYVRDQLVRPLIDVPSSRFFVLPCGIDLQAFAPAQRNEMRRKYDLPDTFVISPGAVTELKGTANVVAASERYGDLAPTIFIGDGDLRRTLERELGDRGRFLGFVPEYDKTALINEATVLAAAPNKLEHFGIIYAEALASGTVPVAYRGGGVDSIITPHVGLLTDRTADDLGEGIRSLLTYPATTRSMGLQARRRAETHFDNKVLSRRFAHWLNEVALASRAPVASAT
jgi:glycosyltransferase involved in cell wall biosynthesis